MNDAAQITPKIDILSPRVEILINPNDGTLCVTKIPLIGHGVSRNDPPFPDEIQRFLNTAERYGYWVATPEENALVGISLF